MKRKLLTPCFVPVLITMLLAGCTGEAGLGADDESAAAGQPMQAAADGQLPSGHPPVQPQMPSPLDPPAGSGTGSMSLTWTDPDGWQRVAPSSSMRRAQYTVPGTGGDAECVVFYFGPGQGGDPEANVLRWADQFGQADGSSSRDVLETETLDVGGIPVLLAEVNGIYSGGMAGMGGPRESLEGYMLLGAVAQGPDANWFFKFTGPEATVREHRASFMQLIESLRRGGESA